MAKKISEMPAIVTPADGDYLPIVDISEIDDADKNKRITISVLSSSVAGSIKLDDISDINSGSPDDGSALVYDLATNTWVPGSPTDVTAIHDNVASEIHVVTEKTMPANDDEILIEDSTDSYNKKRIKISNLPSGGGGADILEVQVFT